MTLEHVCPRETFKGPINKSMLTLKVPCTCNSKIMTEIDHKQIHIKFNTLIFPLNEYNYKCL